MNKILLSLFVTGCFTICSGGPVVYSTASTGFSVSTYAGASCSPFLDSAGDIMTLNAGNYCRALALLDESVAISENETVSLPDLDSQPSLSPVGTTLSDTDSMGVLSVFLLGDSADVSDIGSVGPNALADADAGTRNIFAYMPSIPVTIGLLLVGSWLMLVLRRSKRRRGRSRA